MGQSFSDEYGHPFPHPPRREIREGHKSFFLVIGDPPVRYIGSAQRPPLLYQVDVPQQVEGQQIDRADTIRNAAHVTPKQKVRLIRSSAVINEEQAFGQKIKKQPAPNDAYHLSFMMNADPSACSWVEVSVFVNCQVRYTKNGLIISPLGVDQDSSGKSKKPSTTETDDPGVALESVAKQQGKQFRVFHTKVTKPEPGMPFMTTEAIRLDGLDAELAGGAIAPPASGTSGAEGLSQAQLSRNAADVENMANSRATALGLPTSSNIIIRLIYETTVEPTPPREKGDEAANETSNDSPAAAAASSPNNNEIAQNNSMLTEQMSEPEAPELPTITVHRQAFYSMWSFDKAAWERHAAANGAGAGDALVEPIMCYLCAQVLETRPLAPEGPVELFKIDDVFDIGGDASPVPAARSESNQQAEGAEAAEPPIETEDDDTTCVVCLTDERDTVILPCRHLCLCAACAQTLSVHTKKCPMCRGPIQKLMARK